MMRTHCQRINSEFVAKHANAMPTLCERIGLSYKLALKSSVMYNLQKH